MFSFNSMLHCSIPFLKHGLLWNIGRRNSLNYVLEIIFASWLVLNYLFSHSLFIFVTTNWWTVENSNFEINFLVQSLNEVKKFFLQKSFLDQKLVLLANWCKARKFSSNHWKLKFLAFDCLLSEIVSNFGLVTCQWNNFSSGSLVS